MAEAPAATVKAAPVDEPAPVPVEAEPVWPESLPGNWATINDYEKVSDPAMNNMDGHWGNWSFRSGRCNMEQVDDDGSKRLRISFNLPMDNSKCGTFEYLKGQKGKPQPVDITDIQKVVFLMKSGDENEYAVRFEFTELDPYDAALQGYVGTTRPFIAGKEWQRVEVELDGLLHDMFDRKKGRHVGLMIDRKDQGDSAAGVVLVDNLTLVRKPQ